MNIQSDFANHLSSPPYRVKNALSFVPIVTKDILNGHTVTAVTM